jgi:hypothetical protein
MRCPGFERLIDYLDKRLEGAETDRVAAHIAAGCRECAENRAWYERVRAVAATDDSIEPPPWVLKRAFRIFESKRERPRFRERITQAVARLVFDSLDRPALAGVRSTETASRQLLYRASDYSIDLQIAQADQSSAKITGQILKEGETAFNSVAGLEVRLCREGEIANSALTDALGEFSIAGVERGSYDLIIDLGTEQITIEKLPVEHN